LREQESFVALSTSDFAGDGNPSPNLATERHQRTRGAPGTIALVVRKVEGYSQT
jgi:hypothetical protein